MGTFTPEGTFEAVIARLDDLAALGVTAVELMPVAQFPGRRNWGYDGVYPFAVQDSYGGPRGPETPGGRLPRARAGRRAGRGLQPPGTGGQLPRAISAPTSPTATAPPGGRRSTSTAPTATRSAAIFIENALYWVDATATSTPCASTRCTRSSTSRRDPFLQELAEAVEEQRGAPRPAGPPDRRERPERHAPDPLPRTAAASAWTPSGTTIFHHALHTLLTGERAGLLLRLRATSSSSCKALPRGLRLHRRVLRLPAAAPRQLRRRGIPAERFVVFAQNHDQVGNRMHGDRLGASVPFEALKLAAGLVLLSPYLPLLFMGEEYGEPAPFPYFVSHSDPGLIEAVRTRAPRGVRRLRVAGRAAGSPGRGDVCERPARPRTAAPPRPTSCLWEFYRHLHRLAQTDRRRAGIRPGALGGVRPAADSGSAGCIAPAPAARCSSSFTRPTGPSASRCRCPRAAGARRSTAGRRAGGAPAAPGLR